MATNVNELIFIKRVKKTAHVPAHGGAWKIAYADFVTAMMAFFLLMWLLNATTEDQRTAISNYFAPASVSVSTSGAGGVLGGRTLDSEGAMASNSSQPGLILGMRVPNFENGDGNSEEEWSEEEGAFVQRGPVEAHDIEGTTGSHMGTLDAHDQEQGGGTHLGNVDKNDAKDAKGKFLAHADKKNGPDAELGVSNIAGPEQGVTGDSAQRRENGAGSAERRFAQREQRRFEKTAAALQALFSQDLNLRPYKDNLRVEQIGAGLRIQLLDDQKTAMFPLGSAEMMTETNEMMAKIAESIKKLPNKIAIVGHTDATPYRAGSGYSNWELSTDRAHATRRALIAAGVPEERLVTVTGKAATDPLNKADPEAPSNRRISILLLRETMPPKPLRRGFSDTQSSPFGNYQAPISPSQTVPVVPPRVEQAGGSAFEDRDLDPFESTSPESDADNDADEVVPAPAQTPTESAKAKESKAEAEAFPAEEITPPQEEELIDSDLWQRL